LIAHALSLDERLLHVPFVAAGPGAERLASVGSLAQLAAALAEVAELDSHPWAADELPDGVGLAQFEPPGGGTSAAAADAIREWGLGQDAYDRFTTPLATATDGRTKLLRRGHIVEVFDLETDPLELSPAPLESAADVPAALLDGLEYASTRVVPSVVGEAVAPPGTDVSELEDRMRTLGYL
jgi:hypothetical protein